MNSVGALLRILALLFALSVPSFEKATAPGHSECQRQAARVHCGRCAQRISLPIRSASEHGDSDDDDDERCAQKQLARRRATNRYMGGRPPRFRCLRPEAAAEVTSVEGRILIRTVCTLKNTGPAEKLQVERAKLNRSLRAAQVYYIYSTLADAQCRSHGPVFL